MKGKRLASIDEIKSESKIELVEKQETHLSEEFRMSKKRLRKHYLRGISLMKKNTEIKNSLFLLKKLR